MSDQEGDDQIAQHMDAMLLRLLETPPQSRAELAEAVQRAKRKKPTRARQRRKARALLRRSRLRQAAATEAACP